MDHVSKKILFISKRETAPSTRYRALQYAKFFYDNGWDFKHIADNRSFRRRIAILRKAKESPVVVIVRRTLHVSNKKIMY